MTNLVPIGLVLATVALVVLLVLMARKWRSEELAREAQLKKDRKLEEGRAKDELKKKIEEGTHVEDGRERCSIKGCTHAATMPGLHFERPSHSFEAWARRILSGRPGQQARLRVVLTKRLKYCAPHHAVLTARFQHRAADHQAAIASFIAHEDADLADFEHGVDDAVSSELAARRDAPASIPPPSALSPKTPMTPMRRIP